MADVKLSEIGFFLNFSRLTESFDKLKKGKKLSLQLRTHTHQLDFIMLQNYRVNGYRKILGRWS
jgi:hypothetical protein